MDSGDSVGKADPRVLVHRGLLGWDGLAVGVAAAAGDLKVAGGALVRRVAGIGVGVKVQLADPAGRGFAEPWDGVSAVGVGGERACDDATAANLNGAWWRFEAVGRQDPAQRAGAGFLDHTELSEALGVPPYETLVARANAVVAPVVHNPPRAVAAVRTGPTIEVTAPVVRGAFARGDEIGVPRPLERAAIQGDGDADPFRISVASTSSKVPGNDGGPRFLAVVWVIVVGVAVQPVNARAGRRGCRPGRGWERGWGRGQAECRLIRAGAPGG